jgi:type IV secretory pathway TrbD component
MPLTTLIFVLVGFGLLLWLIEKYIPVSPPIKRLLTVVVVVALILWVANLFGLFAYLNTVRVGPVSGHHLGR